MIMERFHERQLSYVFSENWSGWFCERCCWNQKFPDSPTERELLAARIQQEFEDHDCELFAQRYKQQAAGQNSG